MQDTQDLYELVVDAVQQALRDEAGGGEPQLSTRLVSGDVIFMDDQGRRVKSVPVTSLFRKVTSVREKLRVLEQKLNNHKGLDDEEKAELQVYLTRCYGSLTTFNFLFRDEADKFQGAGG
jgi:hypothetical protein